MKNVLMFPINIFVYAFKGVKYSFKVITGGTRREKKESRLEGDELLKELERVQSESKDLKDKMLK